jgi:ribosomal-protein-alanine N-acetyltransferase
VNLIRPLQPDDAERLAEILAASRAFLAPFEPHRPESYFTLSGQREVVEQALEAQAAGMLVAHVILSEDGRVAGRINLNNIVRGPFLSCSVGYWLDERATGRGLASRALAAMLDVAFFEVGLHRVEAGTLVDNVASQKVLERNGFIRFGLAPRYLHIAGEWRDHLLFQKLRPGG